MTARRAIGVAAGAVAVIIGGVAVLLSVSADPVASPRSGGAVRSGAGQRLAVPAYIDPASDPGAWTALTRPGSGTVGIVVANVDSGPGSGPDPAWASVIKKAHDAGSEVLGYVDTGYLGGPTGGAVRRARHPVGCHRDAGVAGPGGGGHRRLVPVLRE